MDCVHWETEMDMFIIFGLAFVAYSYLAGRYVEKKKYGDAVRSSLLALFFGVLAVKAFVV